MAAVVLILIFYQRKVKFVLNGKQIGTAKYKRGEDLNFPINLARYKWFNDKEEIHLLTQQKMGWFGFTVYKSTENMPNGNDKDIFIEKESEVKKPSKTISEKPMSTKDNKDSSKNIKTELQNSVLNNTKSNQKSEIERPEEAAPQLRKSLTESVYKKPLEKLVKKESVKSSEKNK